MLFCFFKLFSIGRIRLISTPLHCSVANLLMVHCGISGYILINILCMCVSVTILGIWGHIHCLTLFTSIYKVYYFIKYKLPLLVKLQILQPCTVALLEWKIQHGKHNYVTCTCQPCLARDNCPQTSCLGLSHGTGQVCHNATGTLAAWGFCMHGYQENMMQAWHQKHNINRVPYIHLNCRCLIGYLYM